MFQTTIAIRTALLAGAATFALSSAAFAQTDVPAGSPPAKHRHHHEAATAGSNRLDLLEKRVEQQADAIEQQADEIKTLKAQLNQNAAPAPVSSAQFEALQNKVDEQAAATKKQAVVAFTPQTPFQHTKTQPTISSPDGKWTFVAGCHGAGRLGELQQGTTLIDSRNGQPQIVR